MSPRSYLELGLIVIAGLAGWGYVHQRDERLRAEGRLELVQAAADSTAAAAATAKRETVERDSARAAVDRREEAARAEAQRRADRATARIPAAADSVVVTAAPADSARVRAQLAVLQGIYEDRDRARLDRIQSDSLVIVELRGLDVTRLTAIGSLESALAASQERGDTALEARPGWVERNLPKVLVPVAFVIGWLARGAAGG